MGADSGHHYCTRAGHGGGGRQDAAVDKIFRPAAAGRARIGPAKAAATANLGHQIFVFFGHFWPTHTSFPQFLDPLDSFPWSLFADSSPFESCDENKVATKTKLVDGWIEFSGHHSNCWTKVMVLMSSWSLGLSIYIWFVNFGYRLVGFPFLGHFG